MTKAIAKKETELKALCGNIADQVLERVQELQGNGALETPKNYSVSNAIQTAKLVLEKTKDRDKKHVLDSCSRDSIAKSLLDMVVQGLSVAKSQGYFIAYGGELSFQRSYFGTVAVIKRVASVASITAEVIREGETFEIAFNEKGEKYIKVHDIKFETLDNDFVGAYAVIRYDNGTQYTEIMTRKMILQAWGQSKAYPVTKDGNIKIDSVHDKFTQEMVKKTVINRAAKLAINSSDDSDILIQSINDSTASEYKNNTPIAIEVEVTKPGKKVIEQQKAGPVEVEEITKQADDMTTPAFAGGAE